MKKMNMLLLAGGTVAAGGLVAYGIRRAYLAGLPDDLYVPPGTIEMGSDAIPEELATNPSLVRQPPPMVRQPRPVSRGIPGTLKIKIREPKCRIVFDEKHYAGSKLGSLFKLGELVSMEQGNNIMRWDAVGSAPTNNTTANLWSPIEHKGTFYYRNVNDWQTKGTLDKLFGSKMSYPIMSDWAPLEQLLFNNGFKKVVAAPGAWTTLTLPPGLYQIITEPPEEGFERHWYYMKGYWEWTKNGPRAFSCEEAVKRMRQGKCPEHYTRFKRWATPASYTDLGAYVLIPDSAGVTLEVTPIESILISERKYISDNTFHKVCKPIDWASSISPFDWVLKYIVQKGFCKKIDE